ncbi:MAG: hypothetical protein SH850_28730 [Planctomycetaceae bacterium]|nr:hypothetical protein [Planctomycetaceae bacterium]
MNTNQTIKRIAREHLGIKTLETRKSDALDFHQVAVRSLAAALDAAYRAGRDAAKPDNAVPSTAFTIGQRVACVELGEDGHIVGYEDDGCILIVDLVAGGTVHVPAADCSAK